jgi:hypothetical protein
MKKTFFKLASLLLACSVVQTTLVTQLEKSNCIAFGSHSRMGTAVAFGMPTGPGRMGTALAFGMATGPGRMGTALAFGMPTGPGRMGTAVAFGMPTTPNRMGTAVAFGMPESGGVKIGWWIGVV